MIIQVYLPQSIKQHVKLKKSILFQFIVTDKVVFDAIYSTCVVYIKTIIIIIVIIIIIIIIIHLGVGKSGGYLQSHEAAR